MKKKYFKMWLVDNWVEIIIGIIIIIILGVTIWVCIGNEKNRISEGTVVDRHYTAGYTTIGSKNSPPCLNECQSRNLYAVGSVMHTNEP